MVPQRIDSLSDSARIWIYQAGKILNENEKTAILAKAEYFIKNWSTHGKSLNAEAVILYNAFLILAVDEEDFAASGCSIDKSIQFIKQLEDDFQTPFLDRKSVALFKDEEIDLMNLDTFISQINEGKVTRNSIIFNNLVSSVRQMKTEWKIPVNKSWLKRYLPEN